MAKHIPPPSYSLFDIRIDNWQESAGEATFSVTVLQSDAGSDTAESTLAASADELKEIGELAISITLTDQEERGLQQFGTRLFQALFPSGISDLYRSSLQHADQQGRNLRIRLRAGMPRVNPIPWELAYDERLKLCLGRSSQTVLSRYVEIPVRAPAAGQVGSGGGSIW